jgi:hypothetical protein
VGESPISARPIGPHAVRSRNKINNKKYFFMELHQNQIVFLIIGKENWCCKGKSSNENYHLAPMMPLIPAV